MSKKGGWTDPHEKSNNPFAGLAAIRDGLAKVEPAPAHEPAPHAESAKEASASIPARAVLQFEKKGRGGKPVTRVRGLGLSAEALEDWGATLRRGLGCGGAVEGDDLIFQGDQRARLASMLRERGVKQVTGH